MAGRRNHESMGKPTYQNISKMNGKYCNLVTIRCRGRKDGPTLLCSYLVTPRHELSRWHWRHGRDGKHENCVNKSLMTKAVASQREKEEYMNHKRITE